MADYRPRLVYDANDPQRKSASAMYAIQPQNLRILA
jgi:hypothetical protein